MEPMSCDDLRRFSADDAAAKHDCEEDDRRAEINSDNEEDDRRAEINSDNEEADQSVHVEDKRVLKRTTSGSFERLRKSVKKVGKTAAGLSIDMRRGTRKLVTLSAQRVQHVVGEPFDYYAWMLGSWTGVFLLFSASGTFLILGGGLMWYWTGGNADYSNSMEDCIWFSWGMFFDPGTQTGLSSSEPVGHKIVAVLLSIVGFIFNLVLLGTVVDRVRSFVDKQREMHVSLRTQSHTLILGWNEKTTYLLKEIFAQEQSVWGRIPLSEWLPIPFVDTRKKHLVIMAREQRFEMLQAINQAYTQKERDSADIEVREGKPWDLDDLKKVSATTALSIIVVADGVSSTRSDQYVIRTLLALVSMKVQANVMVEIRIPENLLVVERLNANRNCTSPISGISTRSLSNKLAALSMFSRSHALCFYELCTSMGSDLHLIEAAHFTNHTVATACECMSDGIILGMLNKDLDKLELVRQDAIIAEGIKLLVLATDLQKTMENSIKAVWYHDGLKSDAAGAFQKGALKVVPENQKASPRLDLTDLTHKECALFTERVCQMQEGAVLKYCLVGWTLDSRELLGSLDEMAAMMMHVTGITMQLHILTSSGKQKKVALVVDGLRHLRVELHRFSKDKLEDPTCLDTLLKLPILQSRGIFFVSDESQEEEDPEVADCLCMSQAFKVAAYIQAFEPSKLERQTQIYLVCELLDYHTHKMVKSGALTQHRCHDDLGANAAEDGAVDVLFYPSLFGLGVHQPLTFNLVNQLLSLNCDTRFSIVKMDGFMSETDMATEWTFGQLTQGLPDGVVAVGYQREHDWKPLLNPCKDESRFWAKADKLIFIRQLDTAEQLLYPSSAMDGLSQGVVNMFRTVTSHETNTHKKTRKKSLW